MSLMDLPYEIPYTWGDIVYIKTDAEQMPVQVTSINLRPTAAIYEVTCAGSVTYHYDFELSFEPSKEYLCKK
jgi:hypothetical protein